MSNELAESVMAVHYMVPRYPTGRSMYALCAGCEWTATFPSQNEARKSHAAHVIDVLNAEDVVVIEVPGQDEIEAEGITFGVGGDCECCPPWIDDNGVSLGLDEAREHAAALLGAASAAERERSEHIVAI
ncbi:Uncharacterised protein [Mycobacteroides abscessus subsp. abscessus]|uniref:hypothetical protein n=1 Tax=Mycobacteroides abscessus TaxID=36809 RepID=UPI000929E281|nr:hypothetical protein [Mycobacteroides abscessus]SIA42536.1 Uncharacterised protein [Mycobacteroides abscessus subsp. abscessus]SIA56579.1 Uncharacterised protein [Mycobacteroides abscessus subsp. abscessus]